MARYISILLMILLVLGLTNAQMKKPETIKLALSGLTCESCVSKVDKALRAVKGVKDVKVDLKNESAEVVLASASVKPDALVKAVVKAGFKAQIGGTPMKAGGEKEESCCSEDEMKKEGDCDGKDCGKDTKVKEQVKKKSGKS